MATTTLTDDRTTTAGPVPTRPARGTGVRLHGEMRGSGFADGQWLIERDGRFVQVSELIHRTTELADGTRTVGEMAEALSEATEFTVEPDAVRLLVERKLVPLGLVAPAEGAEMGSSSPAIPRSPLRMQARTTVLPGSVIAPLTDVLQWLFAPWALIPTMAGILAGHAWLYFEHGLTQALTETLLRPWLFVAVLAIIVVAGVVHELGHASALRYGGGLARRIGAGFYVIYPAFFTDTTDAYRLTRSARVRTDLGGFYFHLLFAMGILGLYLLTGAEFLLVVVLVINLEMTRQLLFPFVRLDGYWLLADLTGIPDLFSQIAPSLRRLLRRGSPGPALKPWVKRIFAVYVAVTIPVLSALAFLFATRLPHFVGVAWNSLRLQADALSRALDRADADSIGLALVQMLILVLPVIGLVVFLVVLARSAIGVARVVRTYRRDAARAGPDRRRADAGAARA